MYVYGACLFYVCCSDRVGVCENVCCVSAVVKDMDHGRSVHVVVLQNNELKVGYPS